MKKGYSWKCRDCGSESKEEHIGTFIRDKLAASGWDQQLLTRPCPKCGKPTVHLGYEFEAKKEPRQVIVKCIVGLLDPTHPYLPMMWETAFEDEPEIPVFDFKFVQGRNPFGLNKPAVLRQEGLQKVFALYCEKRGIQSFP